MHHLPQCSTGLHVWVGSPSTAHALFATMAGRVRVCVCGDGGRAGPCYTRQIVVSCEGGAAGLFSGRICDPGCSVPRDPPPTHAHV